MRDITNSVDAAAVLQQPFKDQEIANNIKTMQSGMTDFIQQNGGSQAGALATVAPDASNAIVDVTAETVGQATTGRFAGLRGKASDVLDAAKDNTSKAAGAAKKHGKQLIQWGNNLPPAAKATVAVLGTVGLAVGTKMAIDKSAEKAVQNKWQTQIREERAAQAHAVGIG